VFGHNIIFSDEYKFGNNVGDAALVVNWPGTRRLVVNWPSIRPKY
jgi:hypothetical protein